MEEWPRLIENWWKVSPIRPSLYLPDGPLGGKPGDMSHELTFLALRAEKLILELDAFELLILTRCKTVQIVGANHDLVFADFEQLILDGSWLERGRILPRAKIYKSGKVRFARPVLFSVP